MTTQEKLNEFLKNPALTAQEELVKGYIINVDGQLKAKKQEIDQIMVSLREAEVAHVKLSGALDALVALACETVDGRVSAV